MYLGSISANGKTATVSYMPGWGDPGEWHIRLGEDDEFSISLMPNPENQLQFLSMLAADKYILQIADNDWKEVGDEDDVIRICLEYTGYNDANRAEDEALILKTEKIIEEIISKIRVYTMITSNLDLAELAKIVNEGNSAVNDLKDSINKLQKVLKVYDALKEGKPVGTGWSNETLLRDFPDSREAQLISKHLQKTK